MAREYKEPSELQKLSDAELRNEQEYWQKEFDQFAGSRGPAMARERMVVTEMLHAIEREADRRGIDLA